MEPAAAPRAVAARGPIAVLALQGGFDAHADALRRAGHDVILARGADDLARASGLVLPGGESPAILRLLERLDLWDALEALGRRVPVLATCAGLILAARDVRPAQRSLGWLDVAVDRNAWGRQVASFDAPADATSRLGPGEPLVHIRAPRVVDVGPDVLVLATYRGEPVLVRQGRVVGATFHPELTQRLDVHEAVFGPPVAV